jgi:hypothetical protein
MKDYFLKFYGEDLGPLVKAEMAELKIHSGPRFARLVAAYFLKDKSELAKKFFELEKNRLGMS